ncbi:glycosyltransferase family 2 protein [Marinicella litoralis]|uniref:Glycosyltransferase 2-like domain-containing protein n=1 Tax=Marinicella litoralis TaxID=644220 RepID=A0A4R6XS92_9GAMM|nr:glycosyltransferase family 2 protein [Marinicella litoralis]TDR20817.1 hypothetical protein C8D91_1795 [Marinicella litoralis]
MKLSQCIDVVIVNYNSGQALQTCIDSLKGSDVINITVVDNNSTDDSLTAVLDQSDDIEWIKNDSNVGFATACNQGAEHGKADQIAFINPDCFIAANQLLQLAQDLNAYPQASLIGCRVLNQDHTLQAATRRRLPTLWRVFTHVSRLSVLPFIKGINIKDEGLFDQVVEVEAVNGACLMVNRTDFASVGGYDELYPLHFEDLDLFTRLLKTGKKLIYQANIEAKHIQGNAEQSSRQIKQWKKQGLQRYFQKHRPSWEAKIITWMTHLK